MKRLLGGIAVLCIATSAGAQQPSRVDTKTIELKHLKPAEAVRLLRPYIINAAGGVFDVSETIPIVTIRDVADNIERMEKVLAKYDHSPATVRLVFQLIEADTGNRLIAASNTRNQIPVELDSTLRSVLRFPVYRLLSQGVSSTGENAMVRQTLGEAGPGVSYFLQATVGTIRIRDAESTAPTGTVNLDVYLGRETGVTSGSGDRPTETLLTTRLDVPLGNTVVLGTAATRINGVALILTVRPELVRVEK
jgi:hypothetical protein